MIKSTAALLAALCLFAHASFAQSADINQPLVLTSVAPINTLVSALLQDTGIEVKNVPQRARSLAAQPTWFSKQAEPFYADFARADAVVSMGNVWPYDSLFLSVREQNVRIVNIDATLPYSSELTGISALQDENGDVSPYFWLSPANLLRSAMIVGADLQRLYPQQAAKIQLNTQATTQHLVELKKDLELQLLDVADPYVFALAGEFEYLTNEFGIFVDQVFIKQDIDWTEQDLANLTERLSASDIPVVIHKWQPSEAIVKAIEAAGSKLVVLSTFETTSDSSLDSLAGDNMRALLAGF